MNNTERPKKKKSGFKTFLIIAAIIGVFSVIVDVASSSEEDTTYYEEPAYVQEDELTEQITTTTTTASTATTTTTTTTATTTTATSISNSTEPTSSDESSELFANSPNAIYNAGNGFTVEYDITFPELVETYRSIIAGTTEEEYLADMRLSYEPTIDDFMPVDGFKEAGIDAYYYNYFASPGSTPGDKLLAQIQIFVCSNSGNVIGLAYHHRDSEKYFNNNAYSDAYTLYGVEKPIYWFMAMTGKDYNHSSFLYTAIVNEHISGGVKQPLPINQNTGENNWAEEYMFYHEADVGNVLTYHFFLGGVSFFSVL